MSNLDNVNDQHLFHGVHILGEMYEIDKNDLDDVQKLTAALKKGIEESGASICGIQQKQFSPNGVTILALLSESHASIHTYPEQNALFFDAFTCGTRCNPLRIAQALSEVLKPKRCELKTVERGRPPYPMDMASHTAQLAALNNFSDAPLH